MKSDSQQRGRGQNKHYWTLEEDKALIEALVELSTNAVWRAENGFRNGYLFQLEKMIKEKFPQTTVKAVPNIESRVKFFRSRTSAIANVLRVSGFVWNHERSIIECEKNAYEEYVKDHKEAAVLYGKSFPFFNDLVTVFIKDKAHEDARGDIGDDIDQYLHDNISLDEDAASSQMPSDDFFMPKQEPIEPPSPMASDNSASKTSGHRKRKSLPRDPTMEIISENFRHFVEMVGLGFRAMAEFAARNVETTARNAETAARNAETAALKEATCKEIEEKKKLLSQVIFEIDGLSDEEAMFILQVLANHEDQLKIFWDLPDDKRLLFCRVFLARMSYRPPNM